ncbi:ABC transporter ATP-binding protein [Pseudalkalibacillus hwajinpoensis]|nr:ABC transporter ATP-binding protein [Pseudalkalibacillus hwajinpoensis]
MNKQLIKFLVFNISFQKKTIIIYLLISLILSVLYLALPLLAKYFIDNVLMDTDSQMLTAFTLLLLIIIIFLLLFIFLKSYLNIKTISNSNLHLRKKALNKLTRIRSLNQLKGINVVQLMNNDIPVCQNIVNNTAINLVLNTITLVGVILILSYIEIKILIVMLIIFLFYFCFYKILGDKIYSVNRRIISFRDKISNSSEQINNNFIAFKYYNENSHLYKRLLKDFNYTNYLHHKNGFLSSYLSLLNSLVLYLYFIILFFYGGLSVLKGSITLGDFFTIFIYTGMFLTPARNLSSLMIQLKTQLISVNRVKNFFELEDEAMILNPDNSLRISEGKITLKQAVVSIDKKTIVSGLEMDFQRGKVNFLLGKNGVGKSSLILSLLKFNDSRNIYIDGKEFDEIPPKQIRSIIGVSLQQPQFTSNFISQNILNAQKRGSNSQISLHIQKEIEESAEKLLRNIRKKNVVSNLSSGEKQLMSIFCALYSNPEVLVLDESLSNLDHTAKKEMIDLIDKINEDITCIVIDHNHVETQKNISSEYQLNFVE